MWHRFYYYSSPYVSSESSSLEVRSTTISKSPWYLLLLETDHGVAGVSYHEYPSTPLGIEDSSSPTLWFLFTSFSL